ncbi:hypothetical protein AAL85_07495 [Salmonella enterica subsp. enterica serovar Typhi]|nr:hypothetical protein [Salmonella enterica subsp. enterica serovar Typhi]
MANRMILNETAWFGRGAVDALTDEVTRRGYHKALIVTDKTLAQAAFDDVCTGGNPREASLADIVELYHTAW